MAAQDIVISPIITEKSMSGIAAKKYTFEVAKNATKIDIARAVEELFGVKVTKVNTLHVRGHLRRQGRFSADDAADLALIERARDERWSYMRETWG